MPTLTQLCPIRCEAPSHFALSCESDDTEASREVSRGLLWTTEIRTWRRSFPSTTLFVGCNIAKILLPLPATQEEWSLVTPRTSEIPSAANGEPLIGPTPLSPAVVKTCRPGAQDSTSTSKPEDEDQPYKPLDSDEEELIAQHVCLPSAMNGGPEDGGPGVTAVIMPRKAGFFERAFGGKHEDEAVIKQRLLVLEWIEAELSRPTLRV